MLTDLDREDESKVNEAVTAAARPRGRQAVPAACRTSTRLAADEGERGVYLCHVVCELGSTELTKALGWFKDFLDTHPDEVVILFIEDQVSPEDTAEAFEQSGILRYAYEHRPAGRSRPCAR